WAVGATRELRQLRREHRLVDLGAARADDRRAPRGVTRAQRRQLADDVAAAQREPGRADRIRDLARQRCARLAAGDAAVVAGDRERLDRERDRTIVVLDRERG